MRFSFARASVVARLAVLILLASVPAAFSHAQLLSTTPEANAILPEAPVDVQLQFNEAVSALKIALLTPDGSSTDLLGATSNGETVAIALPADLAAGTHVLAWRVASIDGHPIAGSLIFSIGSITGAPQQVATSDPLVAVAIWATKALLFAALFVGVGGAAFGALIPLPVAPRRLSMLAATVGLLVAPISLALQGLDALGLPLAAILSAEAWHAGLATSYAATAIGMFVAFLLALIALALTHRLPAQWLGGLAFLFGASALALSGHASAASPQGLTRPAVFLHLGGILFWIGSLFPLWSLLRDRSDAASRALAVFSRFIPWAVGPLVLSGIVLAGVQLGPPGPNWLTGYTAILAAKLALLALLFALALWNRFWLTAPALAGDAQARQRLRRSIGIEAILVLLVIGLVAGWRFTPPPRAISSIETPLAEPIFVHLMDSSTMAMLELTPGGVGPVRLDIDIADAEGWPLSPEAVAVTLSQPELGIEPFRLEASQAEDRWTVETVIIPAPGLWHVEVDIRMSRFSLVRLQDTAEIFP